jgi:hypothetical protein
MAKDVLEESTRLSHWKQIDNAINKLTDKELLLVNINKLPIPLLNHYEISTIERLLNDIQRALNVFVNNKELNNKKPSKDDYNLKALYVKRG